jgi:hypothetical protein
MVIWLAYWFIVPSIMYSHNNCVIAKPNHSHLFVPSHTIPRVEKTSASARNGPNAEADVISIRTLKALGCHLA